MQRFVISSAAMALVSMTANVSRELRDAFVATLPEGMSVNRALRELIETAIAPKVVADELRDPAPDDVYWKDAAAPTTTSARTGDETWAALREGAALARDLRDGELSASHSSAPDPGCVHPRGTLYRSDHSVICGACGKVVR